ncbi:MAG TPA: amylo-alpha-1,6-glucosidase [Candidatus Elarobacter sp.]|jgi:predicted glycogen debranching enzyme|nr:amylo-alpha-1,6-glucosidase [Candidatus Elarobacter sp.]
MADAGPAQVRFGRGLCGDLAAAEVREWLLTNGRGGYAMGTVAGTLTRRYHGLLIAAADPPVTRRLVVARLDLDAGYDGRTYALATNRWRSGAIAPEGWRLAEAFTLEDGLPTWTYALGDALLDVTLAMPHGVDAIAVLLRAVRARSDLAVRGRLIVADRDHHGGSLPDPAGFTTDVTGDGLTIALPASGAALRVAAPRAVSVETARERYDGYLLPRETERGLQDVDDYLHACTIAWRLSPGDEQGVVASFAAHGAGDVVSGDAREIVRARREANRALAGAQRTPLLGRLALAADAFVVARRSRDAGDTPTPATPDLEGTTVIAGYPWFTDWGRDTMISLPGLLLGTGRTDDATAVLRTFAAHVDGGLIPNRFPDAGGPAEYNTIDASLWFVEAVRAYVAETKDASLLADVFPAVEAVIDGYRRGTRYGIGVDADGLVRGGADGLQLTWMDAKIGDRVITPRRGKPVEVNALWYNALRACETFAALLGRSPDVYRADADRTAAAMNRFWSAECGWCYDVLDGPNGDDATFRPNQLFTVSLFATAFDTVRARAIVDACASRLWTSIGLRTLSPDDPAYRGTITGPQEARDAAYHQGTVWPWLLGPFVRAHLRAYGDRDRVRTFVQPLIDALDADAIGTLPEIADGDPPHTPRGCPAQAWSVGELIAVLRLLDER